jgi:hypothetical protein
LLAERQEPLRFTSCGLGLDALEPARLLELQGVVQKTSKLLEQALVRREAENEPFEEQKDFM